MSLRPRQTGPTGLTVWVLPDSGLEIMWPGPGAGLFIGRATTPGGAVTRIEHPTADGQYMKRADAQRAVDAFLAAGTE
jgi:hypothetical protein